MKSCSTNTKETHVTISTRYGDIEIKLYDDTPQHRDNFIKHVQEGTYDGTLFHRVIEGFMIQGGDPASKNARPGARLGGGDIGYTLPAEIQTPARYHKKGALAAARLGDNHNPEKRSSGTQFYIVTGTTLTNGQLDTLAHQKTRQQEQHIFTQLAIQHRDEMMQLRKNRDHAGFHALQEQLVAETKKQMQAQPPVTFTEEQRQTYTTIGGAPHLDGEYTVFGEVVAGMDVIERIQKVSTDDADRPLDDITMTMKLKKK
ncbi:MAG: peptidylprolyl isomerase [Coprobacter sp.]|nr:peptidylprolyl isomerase [Coprobacter sp.]